MKWKGKCYRRMGGQMKAIPLIPSQLHGGEVTRGLKGISMMICENIVL